MYFNMSEENKRKSDETFTVSIGAKGLIAVITGILSLLGVSNITTRSLAPKEVVESAPLKVVEELLERKLLEKENADKDIEMEQMRADILQEVNRDARITSSERLLNKHDERLDEIEDTYVEQSIILNEIRDNTREVD